MRTAAAHDVSIRQLQYVVAVADTLGFHKAAERCGVSQPTLSSQIQKLEDVLGVQVFERNRQRVLVTKAGEAVVAQARRVLLDLEDLLAAATATQDPFAGTLRLAVIPTIAPYLLPWVTPAIAERWPKLRLALVEEKTEDLLASLRSGTIDAGLLALVDGMDDVAYARVREDPFVAAVPQAHPLAKKKSIALADLDDEPVLLLDDGHCLRTQALALCQRAGATETDLRATSLATLVQMVSAGVGVTLLPSIAVDVENRRGQLAIRPLAGRAQGRTIVLAWRRESAIAAPLTELAKVMAAAAKAA
ncbi:MAG: LysR family transcriptional regulator [Labilithrix sp.]|nr:LysR family transcriptional regulator [Labilithrix sp.]MCW5814591.1 LysR family transcriptional regulator [Labilithrix sp.]